MAVRRRVARDDKQRDAAANGEQRQNARHPADAAAKDRFLFLGHSFPSPSWLFRAGAATRRGADTDRTVRAGGDFYLAERKPSQVAQKHLPGERRRQTAEDLDDL